MKLVSKRTKIVCTIGPASHEVATMVALGAAGMDIARLNFSHGTKADHRESMRRLASAGRKLGRPFGILQDLQGPKIRVGDLPKMGVFLKEGSEAIFSTAAFVRPGDIPVTLHSLHHDVKPGEHVLFDDGLLEVRVKRIDGPRIHTEVITGGILLPHKGLNLPGTSLHIPALSKKDRDDAIFGASMGVDFIALSFVRSPNDVKDLRRLLQKTRGGKDIRIIAKIEKREAIDCFDQILPLVDGIMVARGDLGIETPAAEVPVVQKQLIRACREVGTPVIVATQMLDSMQRNPRPTRAEVSDVANAVVEHADAVMLSGETASGKYPVEAVKMMSQTIVNMEGTPFDDLNPLNVTTPTDEVHAMCFAGRLMVDSLRAKHVFVLGDESLVRLYASFRPETMVHALTKDVHASRVMRLSWGVNPLLVKSLKMSSSILSSCGVKRGESYVVLQKEKGMVRLEAVKA